MTGVTASYGTALRHIWPFTLVHVALRAVVAVLLVPAAGLAVSGGMHWAGAPALTDQDIARFALSLPGVIAGLTLAGVLFLAAVMDLAVMTVFLWLGKQSIGDALSRDMHFVMGRLGRLFAFGVLLVLRVAAIAAPFVLAVGGLGLLMLGAHDINFYLTHRPPDFLVTVALGGAIVLAMAGVLLWQLSGWALALHLMLLEDTAPKDSFAASAARLQGRRRAVLMQLAGWFAVRLGLFALAGMLMGVVIAGVQDVMLPDLGRVIAVTLAGLGLWAVLNAVLAGLTNGALAALLSDLYRIGGDAPALRAMSREMSRRAPGLKFATAIGLAGIVMGAGAVYLLEQMPEARAGAGPRNVEVIAHRGAAALRPENTLAAVEQALRDRADWIEIDVQETADDEVVVAHDSDFMKLAGVDLKVWDARMQDLVRIDIGSWFHPLYADQRTPTLREVLDLAKGRGRVLIELKYYGHDKALERRVAEVVEAAGMVQDVMVMSLKVGGVAKMRALRPDWPVGVLAARAIGDLSALDAEFVAVNTGQVSAGMVRRAHAAGKKVYVWTVDDPLTMSRMLSLGVDGLITNDPGLARRVIAQRQTLSGAERVVLWLSDRFRLRSLDLIAEETEA